MEKTLKCRRATLADKNAVVNITSAFGGRDYMPTYYNRMIEEPFFIGVLGELEEAVVAFAGAYIINGQATMMTKGSRVKEELRGLGIYRILWQYLKEAIRQQYPNVQKEEFTCQTSTQQRCCSHDNSKYREVYRRPLSEFVIPKINHTYEDTLMAHHTQEMGFNELRRIFENKSLTSILFPKRLVIDWIVYQPTVENVDIMKRKGAYMTKTVDSDINSVTTDPVKSDLDLRTSLVAFGTPFATRGYLAYTIDFYGHSLIPGDIDQHLKNHIRRTMSLYDGEIHFLISADYGLMTSIEESCQSLGFVPKQFLTTHCVTLARDI